MKLRCVARGAVYLRSLSLALRRQGSGGAELVEREYLMEERSRTGGPFMTTARHTRYPAKTREAMRSELAARSIIVSTV
jgi:hypothetical protein